MKPEMKTPEAMVQKIEPQPPKDNSKVTEGNNRASAEKQTVQKIVPSVSKAEDKTATKTAELFKQKQKATTQQKIVASSSKGNANVTERGRGFCAGSRQRPKAGYDSKSPEV